MKGTIGLQWLFCIVIAISPVGGQEPTTDLAFSLLSDSAGPVMQATESFRLRVVDEEGQPITGARVTPWALRSGQGHGSWRSDGEDRSEIKPTSTRTDQDGIAVVKYPKFRNVEEQTKTIGVSVSIDHPDYVLAGSVHLDLPYDLKTADPVVLKAGVDLFVRPMIDGKPADPNLIVANWSDSRCWKDPGVMEAVDSQTLKFPSLEIGDASVLLMRVLDDQITHSSRIVDVNLKADQRNEIAVDLKPVVPIKGQLDPAVPRPIRNGRVVCWTLDPTVDYERAGFHSWSPVSENGDFVIPVWPTGEAIQLAGICDGYIGVSGEAPPEVSNPRNPDPYLRAQVMRPDQGDPVVLRMEPLLRCNITVVDEQEQPVEGVRVGSWPNIQWWNNGSQVYCDSLVSGEDMIRVRDGKKDYEAFLSEEYGYPFEIQTDRKGQGTLMLPKGSQSLAVKDDRYELPAFLGRRYTKIEMVSGERSKITLTVQRKGTDHLGEWDKLAGVVFGCSTREGRRICALPEVREKMDEFAKTFREGKNRQDPKLLAEAFTIVADAFVKAGDLNESMKWRKKAAEQQGKVAP
ncbi:Ig-like domain-containing protein [Stieleria sp. ICT_E10.1]|uniref:Ig-like domain-containing protein n=1 Tax=Stieleria sedimenti TaxID=2976331 RepID=UPI00217F6430|nr:Ig-like domain-containing protein [Stieleria sedimenti]MCS7469211.1 Ig-like domain-containing protein [Stieleria sedimenti]